MCIWRVPGVGSLDVPARAVPTVVPSFADCPASGSQESFSPSDFLLSTIHFPFSLCLIRDIEEPITLCFYASTDRHPQQITLQPVDLFLEDSIRESLGIKGFS